MDLKNDKTLADLQDAYAKMAHKEVITEGINDHEAVHKKILGKLHKQHPELDLHTAKHVMKSKTGDDDGEELHVYDVDHEVPSVMKHTFKSLTSRVEIHHIKDHKSGKFWAHATVSQNWTHHDHGSNGKNISTLSHDHPAHPGITHFRPDGGAHKEV